MFLFTAILKALPFTTAVLSGTTSAPSTATLANGNYVIIIGKNDSPSSIPPLSEVTFYPSHKNQITGLFLGYQTNNGQRVIILGKRNNDDWTLSNEIRVERISPNDKVEFTINDNSIKNMAFLPLGSTLSFPVQHRPNPNTEKYIVSGVNVSEKDYAPVMHISLQGVSNELSYSTRNAKNFTVISEGVSATTLNRTIIERPTPDPRPVTAPIVSALPKVEVPRLENLNIIIRGNCLERLQPYNGRPILIRNEASNKFLAGFLEIEGEKLYIRSNEGEKEPVTLADFQNGLAYSIGKTVEGDINARTYNTEIPQFLRLFTVKTEDTVNINNQITGRTEPVQVSSIQYDKDTISFLINGEHKVRCYGVPELVQIKNTNLAQAISENWALYSNKQAVFINNNTYIAGAIRDTITNHIVLEYCPSFNSERTTGAINPKDYDSVFILTSEPTTYALQAGEKENSHIVEFLSLLTAGSNSAILYNDGMLFLDSIQATSTSVSIREGRKTYIVSLNIAEKALSIQSN